MADAILDLSGDVRRRSRARARPAGDERGRLAWVGGRGWWAASSSCGSGRCAETDLKALGDAAPDGPILGARVEHEGAKQALLADDPGVFFTTPHFDGYPAILVVLDRITPEDLRETVVEAWLCRAPKRVVAAYLEDES